MAEHFIGKYEVEYKFRIQGHEAILKRLRSLGATEFVAQNQETDTYFDRVDSPLVHRDISMSVRSMEPSGIKLWIVKGPGNDRCEAVKIESVDKTHSMLKTLGYQATFCITKTRSIYFLGQFHITLDRVSELGDFAEIAVMTDDKHRLDELKAGCLELGEKLGLEHSDIESRSYRQLLGY